ncbi:MAG: cysteine synthase A [SAR324 cluster bacterium]|uniref:Cysteine synthase n=1 Tax=SAR324 cluster bacterium TaxID=2024889 RepID=A0A7X9FTB9_9DELT|nr:cysteine synthase A [SAR324 cluster bacterium]
MKALNILETIGNTPHLRINNLFHPSYEVWVKLECANPGNSIKDRIALSMVEDAERNGILRKGMMIVEPTSGNTGIGLAMVAAVKGYELILVMPESMSIERRRVMRAYGASLELTPRELGMKGAIARAQELHRENPNSWIPMQFENLSNVETHRVNTAMEIKKDFPEGIDFLITGVGTGGHITGCALTLKECFPNLKVFAVEPSKSPVIGGGSHSPHKIQGIGAGFIPTVLDTSLLDGVIHVEEEEAFSFALKAARKEGLFCGISSGATLAAISKKISEISSGSRILGFCYDTGERYLSVDSLF